MKRAVWSSLPRTHLFQPVLLVATIGHVKVAGGAAGWRSRTECAGGRLAKARTASDQDHGKSDKQFFMMFSLLTNEHRMHLNAIGQVYKVTLGAIRCQGDNAEVATFSRFSVSRIGGKGQHPRTKNEAGRMKLDYLEVFTRFGSRLDACV